MAPPLTNLNNPNSITTDGSTVDAESWTTDWSTLVNYINASLTASFNQFQNKGDILCYDGSNIQVLNASNVTNGWVLTCNTGAPFGLQWEAPPGLPLTTNGDTLYYNSGAQRLPIGTSGQALIVSGGLPVWGNVSGTLPVGAIIMWSGTINNIPTGWALCDGQSNASGTNLQGLFVVGAGGTSPGATGGMGLMNPGGPYGNTSAGAGLGPSHNHNVSFISVGGSGGNAVQYSTFAAATVTPRYYALCYIELQP